MASYGYTFVSGDTLTPTKLNNARTVSDIVNADIKSDAAIALSKLGTGALPAGITVASANLVDGTIVDADISNTANIALSKLATGALPTAITVASANIVNGTIVNEDISNTAGITHTKLANITAGQVLMGNASNAPTATALSGDVTVNSSGVTAIGSGVIVDADVNASAAIALSKLATGALPTAITVSSSNMVTATAQALVPAGAVMPFAMNSAPSGWLAANGDAVSRSTYAALFTAIGVAHGAGDGVNTFNLPDLRGIFVRGSGEQTIGGITYNKTFANKEGDQMQGHIHTISPATVVAPTGGLGYAGAGTASGASTSMGGPVSDGTNGTPRVGTQTHPANIALLYCIKF